MRPTVLEKINPFIKVVTILVCGILMALTSSWKLNLAVLIAALLALLLLSDCKLSSLVKTFVPVILLAGAVFVSGMSYGKSAAQSASIYDVASMDSALLLSTRILAYVGMGMVFALSTDQKEFIMSLMHQAHVKPKFAYGVLAAVNLIPTLRREWDEVNLAYRARKKRTGLLPIGPLFNTLVNGIRWSENVAMAMESKGFDGDGSRTFAITTRVRAGDICFAVLCIGLMAAGMICL
ncbi:energy-coupling factor transporter transmembrane component T [Butyricicoccus intestinisimiae]|uniref:Energy-coupling factor transporter transmembrane protein EcfT n=1 Tax=Butyricicoccus intestinisimiae TaxID=2841509 RepID=A0ABS6ER02_9FIRM|nr:energy-coupling factor transporter transmembrane component T [Butyricicoccus intestinisimiae]MBU5489551.1 energy-coupling factor transporter transmembrane protein EcfT [Butyricicoccus intestinisimiae]